MIASHVPQQAHSSPSPSFEAAAKRTWGAEHNVTCQLFFLCDDATSGNNDAGSVLTTTPLRIMLRIVSCVARTGSTRTRRDQQVRLPQNVIQNCEHKSDTPGPDAEVNACVSRWHKGSHGACRGGSRAEGRREGLQIGALLLVITELQMISAGSQPSGPTNKAMNPWRPRRKILVASEGPDL